jgi:hypothetical protein
VSVAAGVLAMDDSDDLYIELTIDSDEMGTADIPVARAAAASADGAR